MDWSRWKAQDRQSLILIWLIVIYEIGMLIAATAPYYNADTEGAHYLFMRDYLRQGFIAPIAQNGFSYYPQAIEMMLLPAFRIAGFERSGGWRFMLLVYAVDACCVDCGILCVEGKDFSWLAHGSSCMRIAYVGYVDLHGLYRYRCHAICSCVDIHLAKLPGKMPNQVVKSILFLLEYSWDGGFRQVFIAIFIIIIWNPCLIANSKSKIENEIPAGYIMGRNSISYICCTVVFEKLICNGKSGLSVFAECRGGIENDAWRRCGHVG